MWIDAVIKLFDKYQSSKRETFRPDPQNIDRWCGERLKNWGYTTKIRKKNVFDESQKELEGKWYVMTCGIVQIIYFGPSSFFQE